MGGGLIVTTEDIIGPEELVTSYGDQYDWDTTLNGQHLQN